MHRKRKAALLVLSASALLLSFSQVASAWGAEWHMACTYLSALESGYGHEASYLMGRLNYNIDFGTTTSIPFIGSPEYHFDYGREVSKTGMKRPELISFHIVESWRCAFEGNDEGFYWNTAAALHPLQDADAHSDDTTLTHIVHLVLGTLFYGEGRLFSWLDDPFSEDVYTRKADRYPADYSSRAENSIRNTLYVLGMQAPMRRISMSGTRVGEIGDMFGRWVKEAALLLGIDEQEAQAISLIGAESAMKVYEKPVSPNHSDYSFEEMAMGYTEACCRGVLASGNGSGDHDFACEGCAPEMAAGVLTESFESYLWHNLSAAAGNLFKPGNGLLKEVGQVDADHPIVAVDLIGRVFVRSAKDAIAKSMRQEETFRLMAEKQDGPSSARPAQ